MIFQKFLPLWRSCDAAETWNAIVVKRGAKSNSPVAINQTVDGTPYVVSDIPQKIIDGSAREVLGIWPLNEKRTDFEPVIIARNCRDEFGSPPGGSTWVCDHPSAATMRLSDGKWHNILAYHILELAEIQRWWHRKGAQTPTPQTGCYVEEVHSPGEAIPAWNF